MLECCRYAICCFTVYVDTLITTGQTFNDCKDGSFSLLLFADNVFLSFTSFVIE